MQPPIPDAQIIALLPRCQRGERAAIEALYDLYADRLYRYLLTRIGDGDAAADLTTEVFVRLIAHVGAFRLNGARPAASFSAWLYRIAANLAADHRRAGRRLAQVSLDDALPNTAPSPHAGPAQMAEEREAVRALAQAFDVLSEDQRLVLAGKFGDELSNAEIAALLGKSEGAVKSLQHRALRTLGRLLSF